MIQRIQSIYLTLIIVLTLLLLSGTVLNFEDGSGNTARLSSTGILSDQSGKTIAQVVSKWPLPLMLISICVISLITIVMFRNRKIQMYLNIALIVLSVILIAAISWLGFSVIQDNRMNLSPGIKMIFPVLILAFSILSFRGIRNDERLVKSYDRLR